MISLYSNGHLHVLHTWISLKPARTWLCGSSASIHLPSLTFIGGGLSVPKIWLIIGHGVKQPGDLDLTRHGHGLPSCQFSASVIDLGSGTEQTNGWTDSDHHCIMPTIWGQGHNKLTLFTTMLHLSSIYTGDRRLATGNVQCVCSATYQIFFNIF